VPESGHNKASLYVTPFLGFPKVGPFLCGPNSTVLFRCSDQTVSIYNEGSTILISQRVSNPVISIRHPLLSRQWAFQIRLWRFSTINAVFPPIPKWHLRVSHLSPPLPEASSFNQMTISHRSIHCCILIETSFPSGETPFHQSSFESTISSETYLSSRSSACSNSGGGGS